MHRVIVALVMCLVSSPVNGEEKESAWFFENYLPAAQKLANAYAECTVDVSETVSNDKSPDYNTATFHFAYDGTRRKYDRTLISHHGDSTYERTRTVVASPEISFSIYTKQGKSPLLQQVDRSELGFSEASRTIDSAALEAIYAPFALYGKTVAEWLRSKDFKIKSIREEADHVRLTFQIANNEFNAEGWATFRPTLLWVIDRWEMSVQMKKPSGQTFRVASALTYADGDPVPALTGLTTTTFHPNRTVTDKLLVNMMRFGAAPPREFKLSSYGYDDRIAMPASIGTSLWFWLAIGGVACLLAAFAIRQLRAKLAAK